MGLCRARPSCPFGHPWDVRYDGSYRTPHSTCNPLPPRPDNLMLLILILSLTTTNVVIHPRQQPVARAYAPPPSLSPYRPLGVAIPARARVEVPLFVEQLQFTDLSLSGPKLAEYGGTKEGGAGAAYVEWRTMWLGLRRR